MDKTTTSEIHALVARIGELDAVVADRQRQFLEFEKTSIDFLLVTMGIFVFFIQLGFMLYEAGSVRLKNTKNIFIKNTLDCCIGAYGYWALGYGLAFGKSGTDDPGNGFCGNSWFFYSYGPDTKDYAHFFFNFTFVAAATTILSGAVAERVTMHSYLLYSLLLSSFVFPICSHWAWSTTGWLSPFKTGPKLFGVGAIDFAGSGIVHLTGGVAASVGVYWIGPRLGRYHNPALGNPFKPHSANLQVLGTFIQWIGWYGFNCGTILTFGLSGFGNTIGRIAITTTLAGSAAGFVSLYFTYYHTGRYDIVSLMNGIIAGLVGITGACATVTPWSSVFIGIISAFIYQYSSVLTLKLRLDDAVDAIAVHFWCGTWGVLSVGIFSRGHEVHEVYGFEEAGLIYGGGKILAANIVLIIVVIAWVGTWMHIFFGTCTYFDMFRISEQAEVDGLDNYYHGGSAFIYSQSDDPANIAATMKQSSSLNVQLNPLQGKIELKTMKSRTFDEFDKDTIPPLDDVLCNEQAFEPSVSATTVPETNSEGLKN